MSKLNFESDLAFYFSSKFPTFQHIPEISFSRRRIKFAGVFIFIDGSFFHCSIILRDFQGKILKMRR